MIDPNIRKYFYLNDAFYLSFFLLSIENKILFRKSEIHKSNNNKIQLTNNKSNT